MNLRTAIGMRIFGATAVLVIGIAQMALAQETVTTQERVRVVHGPGGSVAAGPGDRVDTFVFYSDAVPITPAGGRIDIIRGMGTVPGAVVVGKPYSAVAVTESTQMLADGNRITQRNETRIYRDGQGRTRREQTLGGLGVWQAANEPAMTITIHDPVAGTTYMLNPGTGTAHAIRAFSLAHAQAGLEGSNVEVSVVEAGSAAPAPVPALGGAVAGVRVEAHNVVIEGDDGAPHFETFELPVPAPGARVAGVAAFPPTAAFSAAPFAAGEVINEDLGEQILEGVSAHGSRETHTIPAGAIGNERPIAMVMERWYSDELEADVLRRNVDPRFGETTYKLVSVVLGEPSADLFVVPESYELQTDGTFEFKLQHPEGGNGQAR